MENIHDIIVYLIVGFILILQIKVFLGNYHKIQDYKNTIKQSKNFRMVEVFVDEHEVDKVDVDSLIIEFHEQEMNKNGKGSMDSEIEIFKNASPDHTANKKEEKANSQKDTEDLSSLHKEEDDEMGGLFHVPPSGRRKEIN